MPLKPRVVLATLLGASGIGVCLTWAGTSDAVVAPIASWVAIVSCGAVLTNGILWHRYAQTTETRPEWLIRRWSRLGYVAGGAAVAGLTVRLLSAADVAPAAHAVLIGTSTGVVSLVVGTAAIHQGDHSGSHRRLVLPVAVAAGFGLTAIAWLDVGMDGGPVSAIIVRAVHLVAVGAWMGGAIWHNALVVPALTAAGDTDIRPVVHQFRRVVPLFIVAVLMTGIHQAGTWLGASLSTYLTTTVGLLVGLKFLSVIFLAALVALSRVRSRTSRPNR